MTTHDVHLALDQEAHDAAVQSSLKDLDAQEANLEDTIRAGIVEAIRTERLTNTIEIVGQWTKGYRRGLERAETIASGATL